MIVFIPRLKGDVTHVKCFAPSWPTVRGHEVLTMLTFSWQEWLSRGCNQEMTKRVQVRGNGRVSRL